MRSKFSSSLFIAAALAMAGSSGFAMPFAPATAPRRRHPVSPNDTTRKAYGLTKEQRLWNEQVESRKAAKKAKR